MRRRRGHAQAAVDSGAVIYFIAYGETKWIKIGFASDLKKRLHCLRVSSPEELTVEASVAGTRTQEKALHRALAAHRGNGEWFKPRALVALLVEMAIGGSSADDLIAFAKQPSPSDDAGLKRARDRLFYQRHSNNESLPAEWRERYRRYLLEMDVEDRVRSELESEAA